MTNGRATYETARYVVVLAAILACAVGLWWLNWQLSIGAGNVVTGLVSIQQSIKELRVKSAAQETTLEAHGDDIAKIAKEQKKATAHPKVVVVLPLAVESPAPLQSNVPPTPRAGHRTPR